MVIVSWPKELKILLLVSLFSALIASCSRSGSTDDESADVSKNGDPGKSEVSIGVVAPLTGEGSTYGASMKRGFNLAFSNDENVNLIYEDSKLTAKQGVSAINKLISVDKVQYVYGAASSGVTTAMVPIADRNKIILFSSISTSDGLTDVSPYFFRNVPKNALQGLTAVNYLVAEGSYKKLAVLHENDEYGTNLATSFEDAAKVNQLQIVYKSSYLNTDTDFRSQLDRIKASGADAVFVPGNYEETGIILRQAKELGVDALIIGGDGSYSPTLIEYAGDASEGFVCTIMGIDKTSQIYEKFEDAFEKSYSSKPDVYDTYAYEAGLILKKVIAEGNGNPKLYLASQAFETFSGPLKFEGSDMIRSYGISVVKNGQFTDI